MIQIENTKTEFENGTYDLVVCFYNNSDFESYERGYKSELWFEDGLGNRMGVPNFILNNSFNVIGYKIKKNDDFHTLSDEIIEVIENSGFKRVNHILYSNDVWYIGFSK
jgi:hypothetical protein